MNPLQNIKKWMGIITVSFVKISPEVKIGKMSGRGHYLLVGGGGMPVSRTGPISKTAAQSDQYASKYFCIWFTHQWLPHIYTIHLCILLNISADARIEIRMKIPSFWCKNQSSMTIWTKVKCIKSKKFLAGLRIPRQNISRTPDSRGRGG